MKGVLDILRVLLPDAVHFCNSYTMGCPPVRGDTSSTSTLILHKASASRASDVINMVKSSVFTVKTCGCPV